MLTIKAGATSQTIYLEVLDSASTTGGRKTGIAWNASGLTAYYARTRGAATQITLASLASATAAWTSGGWIEVDATNMPGIYRLDLPDAAVATGAQSVVITVKGASGMVQVSKEIRLVAYDPDDATRLGLSALPTAAAGANGGLPTVDAANAVKVQSGTGANQIDLSSGAVKLQPDQAVNVTKVAGTAQTARDLGAQLDVAVSTRLAASSYTAPDNAGIGAVKAQTDKLTFDASNRVSAKVDEMGANVMTAGALASDAVNEIKDAVFAQVIEGSVSFLGAQRIQLAASAGKTSGFVPGQAGTGTIRDTSDTKTRITAAYDANGNRTSVTLDAT